MVKIFFHSRGVDLKDSQLQEQLSAGGIAINTQETFMECRLSPLTIVLKSVH